MLALDDKRINTRNAAGRLGVFAVCVAQFARSGQRRHDRQHGRLYFDIVDVEALCPARALRPEVFTGAEWVASRAPRRLFATGDGDGRAEKSARAVDRRGATP